MGHRVIIVEIVVNHDFAFVRMRTDAAGPRMDEPTFERKRHSKKEGVQARQVAAS